MNRPYKQSLKTILPAICFILLFSACHVQKHPVVPAAQENEMNRKELKSLMGEALEKAATDGNASVYLKSENNAVFDDHNGTDETQDVVQPGDLAEVDITLSLSDGTILRTTRRDKAELRNDSESGSLYENYRKGEIYAPEPLLTGRPGYDDAVSLEIIGKRAGDKGRLVFTPTSGGLAYDEQKVRIFGRMKYLPVYESVSVEDFIRIFGLKPSVGTLVNKNPYFPSTVTGIADDTVHLKLEIPKKREIDDEIGKTIVTQENDRVTLTLYPVKGAVFKTANMKGRITEIHEEDFVVDFNPPEAGKTLFIDYEIKSVEKKSALSTEKIDWIEDYDQGIQALEHKKMPMLLFLYTDWCPWCKKMAENVFPDAFIRSLGSDFIWTKVNSGDQQDIRDMFDQDSYPTLIMMNSDQSVYRKIEGFQNASQLRKEIRIWMRDLENGRNEYQGLPGQGDSSDVKDNNCSA